MSIQKLIDEEIEVELRSLDGIELGSNEHTTVVNNIIKLCDKSIEYDKMDMQLANFDVESTSKEERFNSELSLKRDQIDSELELKREQFNEEMKLKRTQLENDEKSKEDEKVYQKDQDLWKNCITIGGIVIPTMVSIWGIVKSIKFEETGSFTTIVGRGLVNKIIPKK